MGKAESSFESIENNVILEKAIEIACRAHKGQRDKAGAPYILHPLRVMLQLDSIEERIVAVLHDVMEDGPAEAVQEIKNLLPQRLFEALLAVTKQDDEHGPEGYAHFIERAMHNSIARRVKIADLRDNLDITRLDAISEKDSDRLNRYLRSLRRLQALEEEHEQA